MINKCPHCGKNDCVKYVCFENVLNYGSSSFDLPCKHCNKMITVNIERCINVTRVRKSKLNKSQSDF